MWIDTVPKVIRDVFLKNNSSSDQISEITEKYDVLVETKKILFGTK